MNADQIQLSSDQVFLDRLVARSSNGSLNCRRLRMHEEGNTIMIATEFSAYPAGRDDRDGPNNGSKFRDEILLPRLRVAIERKAKLEVSLDGVLSFGSSFLEEAFGGLVRKGISKKDLKNHLVVTATMVGSARYLQAIERYIERARA